MGFKTVKNVTYLFNLFLLIISGYVYSKGSHFGIGFSILIFIYFPVFLVSLLFLLYDLYLFVFDQKSKFKSSYIFLLLGIIGLIGQIVVNQIIQS